MNLIHDNIIFGLQEIGGISIYWNELQKRANFDPSIKLKIIENYSNRINKSSYYKLKNGSIIPPKVKLLKNLNLNVNKNDIFHSSYYRINKSSLNITTVHDFTFENYFRLNNIPQILLKRNAIHNSDIIICISKNTQEDLLRLYPKVDEKKTRVIYNGVSEEYFPIDNKLLFKNKYPYLEEKNYILFIGSRAIYKNFDVALKVFEKASVKDFIVIGKPFNHSEKKQIQNIKKHVINIPYVNNQDLNILYNYANSLIYPSMYEGFGIPIIEAFRSGCHVLANDSSSINEIGKNHAFLIEKNNIDDYVSIIEELKIDSKISLIKNNLNYSKQFSWDNCYLNTKNIYEEIS